MYGLIPAKSFDIRNVEVVPAEQSFFSVGFDDLKAARKAALVATEYADFVESNLRNYVNNMFDDLISELDSIVARHNKDVGRIKKNSAVAQKLTDADKAAINQIYSANINGIISDTRNAIIDEINAFNGDDDGEEVKEDFATYLRRFEESGGDEHV